MEDLVNTFKVSKSQRRDNNNVNVNFPGLMQNTIIQNNKSHQNGPVRQDEVYMARR